MSDPNTLTPRSAVAVGLLFIACGTFPLLIALGIVTPGPPSSENAPPWMIAAVGAVFVCGGLAIILDYAVAGGVDPDGDLPAGTPLVVRGANLLLGIAIVGLLTAMFGWIAFGRGPRHFSSSISLPFVSTSAASSEWSGRIAFGFAAVFGGGMFIAFFVTGVRRFIHAFRADSSATRP
jgi:hypothetical protein